MNIDEIYEVIKPLKHKKFKWPDLTEKNHELFWKQKEASILSHYALR